MAVHMARLWHSDTLSALTMVAAMAVATRDFFTAPEADTGFIWLHVMVHSPFSIRYHCMLDADTLRGDTVMIYAGHMWMHLGLIWDVVSWATILSFASFVVAAAGAIRALAVATDTEVKDVAVAWSWVFALHYVPLLCRGAAWVAGLHVAGFVVIRAAYVASVLDRLWPGVSLTNAVMHCALIANTAIAHRVCADTSRSRP